MLNYEEKRKELIKQNTLKIKHINIGYWAIVDHLKLLYGVTSDMWSEEYPEEFQDKLTGLDHDYDSMRRIVEKRHKKELLLIDHSHT